MSFRKAPEPEEMDKDIILQEKEAEVQSIKPDPTVITLVLNYQCMTVCALCLSAEADARDDR